MSIINIPKIILMIALYAIVHYGTNFFRRQDRDLTVSPMEQAPPEEQLILNNKTIKYVKRNFSDPKQIQFYNSTLAEEILTQLDVYKPLEKKFLPFKPNFTELYYGFNPDFQYCEKVRKYFSEHPESVFEQKPNMLIIKADNDFTRKHVVPFYYKMVDPIIRENMHARLFHSYYFDIKPEISMFVSLMPIYFKREFGTQYSCTTQMANQIPGHNSLGTKDQVAALATAYGKHFESKPQCFNHDKYFPKTFILYKKDECQEFFKILDTPEYEAKKKAQRIVYMRKVGAGSHRGHGVQPVNEGEERALRETYANGQRCGEITQNYIVQHFIGNPLLINDHFKFDFRVFMLIASTNPLMAFYHDGYIRISLIPYNSTSDNVEDEKKMMLTNLMLNKEIYEKARNGVLYNGMDEEGLMNAQQATVGKLGEYLLRKGIVTDPDWTENYLRREMRRAMLHLAKMAQKELKSDSRVFHLFGVDFMLDNEMNLWFIEANAGPAYPNFVPSVHQNMLEMVKSQFEIVFGLLRSRMKRTINFVNQIIKDGSVSYDEEGKLVLTNLARKRNTFAAINRNYFEKEFEPSPENRFGKVIDESKEDPLERYHGLIEPECYDLMKAL